MNNRIHYQKSSYNNCNRKGVEVVLLSQGSGICILLREIF